MPSKSYPKKDPFPNITSWDDGYEYIRPDDPPQSKPAAPYYSSRGMGGGSRDLPRPPLGRDADAYARPRYPSPVSAADTFSRPRRRRTEASPPRRSRRVSPSPDRRGRESRYPPQASQGRPARPLGRTATHPLRSESTRERPRPGGYSRSPSPVRMRKGHDDIGYRDYRRAESPVGRTARRGYSRSPSPPRHSNRSGARPRRSETYRAPSPPPATKMEDPRRPGLARSKTTTAKPKGLAGLSPRWQKAATAAFQAGSAAALNMRSEPGAWKGDKGIRVATAALGAGAFDAFRKGDKADSGRSGSGKPGKKHSEMDAIGGALGGLLLDQITARTGNGKKRH